MKYPSKIQPSPSSIVDNSTRLVLPTDKANAAHSIADNGNNAITNGKARHPAGSISAFRVADVSAARLPNGPAPAIVARKGTEGSRNAAIHAAIEMQASKRPTCSVRPVYPFNWLYNASKPIAKRGAPLPITPPGCPFVSRMTLLLTTHSKPPKLAANPPQCANLDGAISTLPSRSVRLDFHVQYRAVLSKGKASADSGSKWVHLRESR